MTDEKALLHDIDEFVAKSMDAWGIPGVAVAIVKDDRVVAARGYGLQQLGRDARVDGDTVFGIGSNTKAFTSAALGMLVQEGKLSWDDPVIQYLPDFQLYDRYVTHELRVRDLLCHRIGFPTWGGDIVGYGSRYDRAELLRRGRYIQPTFGFRAGYGYSNLTFIAAGQIIPVVTGQSWDDFVVERIFRPLGMSRTNTSVRELEGLDNLAQPHESLDGQVRKVPYRNLDNHGPAGAINSSARDLAEWLRLQLGDGVCAGQRLLEPAIVDEMRKPHTVLPILPISKDLIPTRHFMLYGLGWFLNDYRGRLVVRHDGGVDGMISAVGFLPEEGLGVAVLTNVHPNTANQAVFYHILDAYLGAPERDWIQAFREYDRRLAEAAAKDERRISESHVTGTKPTLPAEAYAGTYRSEAYGDVSVLERDGALTIELSAHPGVGGALEHWHYDTFLCRWSDPVFGTSLVPFVLDGGGKVVEFHLKIRPDWIDPVEYVFKRVSG